MRKPRKRKLKSPKKGKRNKSLVKIMKSKIPIKKNKDTSHSPQTKESTKQRLRKQRLRSKKAKNSMP